MHSFNCHFTSPSSDVGVLCIIVNLELCHHILVFIIVILYGLGAGGHMWDRGWVFTALWGNVMHMDWTTKGVFWTFRNPSRFWTDFKVAWFDLSVGLGGFIWFSCILLYVLYNLMPWGEKENTVTPELLWIKGNITIIMKIIIFICFLCTSWNGLNFALLASIVYWHKVHLFDLLNFKCSLWCL